MNGAGQTWTDLWAECTERLGSSDEARFIVEQASGRQGASWLITLTTPAPIHAVERVQQMIERRLAGEPLQYVLGRWSFRRLSLKVDRRVLIPRPETEQVVSAAIRTIEEYPSPLVADLGTGSGAIALSLALEIEDAQVWASDVSAGALEVAESNLSELSAEARERVHFVKGSWFDALPQYLKGNFDLIVTNPPYVRNDERDSLDSVVKDWEPAGALFSGDLGLDAIEQIVTECPQWLNPAGVLVVEIAPDQDVAVRKLALAAGFASASVGTDYSDRKRWLVAHMANQPV